MQIAVDLASVHTAAVRELQTRPGITLHPVAEPAELVIIDAGPEIMFTSGGARPAVAPVWGLEIGADSTSSLAIGLRELAKQLVMSPSTTELPTVTVVSRADEYHRRIDVIEGAASRVDKLVKRVSVVFKPDGYITAVARQRYGEHSPMYHTYVDTQRARRQIFFEKLEEGSLTQREICYYPDLREHVIRPVHAGVATVDKRMVVEQLRNVINTLREFPQQYSLALSDMRQAFRYAIYDRRMVVMHEAVGAADVHRLNSVFVEDSTVVEGFQDEFEFLWASTPMTMREGKEVVQVLERLVKEAQAQLAS